MILQSIYSVFLKLCNKYVVINLLRLRRGFQRDTINKTLYQHSKPVLGFLHMPRLIQNSLQPTNTTKFHMLTAFHKEMSCWCANKNTQQCSLDVKADKLKTITTNKTVCWTFSNNMQPQHTWTGKELESC